MTVDGHHFRSLTFSWGSRHFNKQNLYPMDFSVSVSECMMLYAALNQICQLSVGGTDVW